MNASFADQAAIAHVPRLAYIDFLCHMFVKRVFIKVTQWEQLSLP